MKSYSKKTSIFAVLILLLFTSLVLSKDNARKNSNPPVKTSNQIVYKITEKAQDGTFKITQETREVDVNADIVIDFASGSNSQSESPSPEWMRLNALLSNVDSVFNERAKIREKIGSCKLSDTTEVKNIRDTINKFDKKSVQAVENWQKILRLNGNDFDNIVNGDFDGNHNPRLTYSNLARWIKKELERLNQKDQQLVDLHTVQVTVQAFHSPVGSARSAMHVDGYDNIPSGELQPIDRTGLRLTSAEKAHLNMEIEMSQKAAESIQKIKESGNEIKNVYVDFYKQINSVLDSITNLLDQISSQLQSNPDSLLTILQTIATNAKLTEKQHVAAKDIINKLSLFKQDFDQIRSKIQQFENLCNSSEKATLNDILLGSDGGIAQYFKVLDSLKTWPTRWESILNDVQTLGTSLTSDQIKGLLLDKVRETFTQLKQKYPAITLMINCVNNLFKQDQTNAIETLAETDLTTIWRNQTDLVNGRIELSRSGMTQGDEVLIKISSRTLVTKESPAKLLNEDTYKMTAVLMNFHREFGASLIFARGFNVQGSANDWKPCVAAHVNWFCHFRDGGKVWNAIEPGFGFHLASLDQGVQNVEFGVGVNITLLQQILTGGIGYNLFNSNPYFFIGLSLFDLLDQAKKITH
jgi:hypothetical protein